MKLLLTGAAGQLGTELRAALRGLGTLHMADRDAPPSKQPGEFEFTAIDLADGDALGALLDNSRPSVVINAAAYTAVDQAESESELAMRVNADAPAAIAQWCAANDALMVHYSTDYVFDGSATRPYRETDATSPINVYGETKLAGEQAIVRSGCRHVILRTSWIYSTHGNNFLRTMLRLASERSHLSVVNDQHGCPTWARNLAGATRQVIDRISDTTWGAQYAGVFHYCDSPATTWYDFAHSIFQPAAERGLIKAVPEVTPVSSEQFQTAARRPQYSVLNTARIRDAFGIQPGDLFASVNLCLEELASNE